MSNPFTPEEMAFLDALSIEGFDPGKPATEAAKAAGILYTDWYLTAIVWRDYRDPNLVKVEYLEPGYVIPNHPPCPWTDREHYLRRACEVLAGSNVPDDELEVCLMKLTRDMTRIRVAMPHGVECPYTEFFVRDNPEYGKACGEKLKDWLFECYKRSKDEVNPEPEQEQIARRQRAMDCPFCGRGVVLGATLLELEPAPKLPVLHRWLHKLELWVASHPNEEDKLIPFKDYPWRIDENALNATREELRRSS